MNHHTLLAAVSIAVSGASAMAGELPTYQVDGLVMSPHQQVVLIPSNAQERLPAIAFVYGSPHQIMVLTPRRHATAAANAVPTPQASEDLLIRVSH